MSCQCFMKVCWTTILCWPKLIFNINSTAIESCTTADEKAGFLDYSNFKIHIENDTHSYINGTWKFLKDIQRPWMFTMFSEKNTRGQWIVEVFNRKVPDMCLELHNPTQPWYYVFKHVPGCPLVAGVSQKNLDILFKL